MHRHAVAFVIAVLLAAAGPWAAARAQNDRAGEVVFKQVAPDLYFLFEFSSSNAVVLTTGDVKLILPDVTFDTEMTIHLGGREIRLAYLGPGQQAGDTFVFFPHARTVFTTGMFGSRSMPNMAFTPSVENWLALLEKLAAM